MSNSWYNDVKEFHRKAGHFIGYFPRIPTTKLKWLRYRLIREEVDETLDAIEKGDLAEIADGLADSIFVLLGTAVTYGISIQPIWDEVVRTNMLKVGGPKRSDGKSLKPSAWSPPRIEELIKEQIDANKRRANSIRGRDSNPLPREENKMSHPSK